MSKEKETTGAKKTKARLFEPETVSEILSDDAPVTAPTSSFADKLYKEITSVIGGDNPNQFFCMGLPGTLIDATQYSYDVEHNEPKPPHVCANESRLVNKLFDACQMSASDNGRHLQTQYKTALDVLTPKLNGKLFDAKTQLRDVLMMPYHYNFEKGGVGESNETLTLGQVFFKLYGEYVKAKQEWAEKQSKKKKELEEEFPEKTEESYKKREDEFLDWYEIVAEAETLVLEEKLDKVFSVFSPGDMEIISAVLDSGAGREVAEARNTLANVGRLTPEGGYIYPVNLYPENWFTLLDTSFNAIDLLESTSALSQKLATLVAQRSNMTNNLNAFLAVIPNKAEVDALKNAKTECDAAFKTAFDSISAQYGNSTFDMLKSLADLMASSNKEKASEADEAAAAKIFGLDIEKVKGLLSLLGDSMKNCMEKQNALVDAAQKATDAALEYFTKKNLLQLKTMLIPLRQQLADNDEQIAALKEKIKLASMMQEKSTQDDKSDVAPNAVPENFTKIIISSTMSEANQQSSSYSSASASSYGVSFFFGGYSSSSSHQEAVSRAFSESSEMAIDIGMSVAKVSIGREWFNPGVFLLTSDMYNTSSTPISPKHGYDKFTPERFKAMNESLFPCFPTSFVIARDVTIKFTSATAMSTSFASSVEDHASHGGGFFIFSGSSSRSSASSNSSAHAKSDSKSVTVRFTNPQILGYYLEATPPDKSSTISGDRGSDGDFISIFKFIEVFKKMLEEHNKKYDKN